MSDDFRVRAIRGESYGEALARALDDYIASNSYFIDKRTKEGRKIKEIREHSWTVKHYMHRTKGMRERFWQEDK